MILIITFLLFGSLGCQNENVPTVAITENTKDSLYFLDPNKIGLVTEKSMDEISGLVSSHRYADHFWCHNDSGDKARLFLINLKGELTHTLNLENTKNRDWEDIAIYKDHSTGKSILYIADIGDNIAQYDFGKIYVFEEPNLDLAEQEINEEAYQTLTFSYPDGPRDAETLMIDPANRDIYIISKREKNVGLYKISYPYPIEKIVAKKVSVLPFTYIVAGDIASDRSALIIKDYNNVYHFKLAKDQAIEEALLEKPYLPPYIREPQGESIAWSTDSKSFFTLSEESPAKVQPVLYRYDKGK